MSLNITNAEDVTDTEPGNVARRNRDLKAAMQGAEAAHQVSQELQKSVSDAVAAPAKVFNTHSNALAGRLIAEENALREVVADLDAQIAKLQEERTDAMLAHSGVAHALQALQKGRP